MMRMRKPPLRLSKDGEKLMARIVSESRPVIRAMLNAAGHTEPPSFDKPAEFAAQGEFLVGLACGVGVALKWLEEYSEDE
jgi:hypothetical protein